MVKWVNDDGLEVRFGLDQAALIAEGRTSVGGEVQELVIDIKAVDITDVDVAALIYKRAGLPQKAQLISAILYVTTIWTSGGSPTLDVGLWHDDGDGTYTVENVEGFDIDIALSALDSVGAKTVMDGAYVNGTDDVVPNDGAGRDLYVSLGFQTADKYTAGEAKLVIKYIKVS